MKTYLFVNPASGRHSAQRLQSALAGLHAKSIVPEVFKVRTPAEIDACCATINRDCEPHLVIVAGGDGTFNAVINGLDPGTAIVAVVPFGTSNVLAAEIGITSNDDAIERIIAGKTASLSVGVLEMQERTLRFVLMAGIGLDGAVVRDVWPLGKRFLKQGAYALSALKNAVAWDSSVFRLTSSDTEVTCHTAIICNASRYGGNFILSPGVTPFSQGLSAVCITEGKRCTYLGSAVDLFRSKTTEGMNIRRIDSSCFEIDGNAPIQIDGDFVGYGPARITECHDFAKIII